ncbi:RagB/SusD family nutrient uptake outer membrane protein [Echinicola shivajiensis]|uniref:RagB/SusD family nutrient uptake outer membrane protein n=1 Tax=Echinicola shivajiensis TaxID=1035916 RepID=UPI001BFCACEF|nr:RagB/SusD family nutrient uptake outer membrane protein [Echinicola shivajiensis]
MKKLTIILILACMSLTGCENFLDKTDPTATSFDEFYNDEDDLRRVVYSSYRDVFTHNSDRRLMLYMQDGRSDNAYARLSGDHHQVIANGNLNANSSAMEYYYSLHMKHLGRLNTFIDKVDVPYVEDEEVRDRYSNILQGIRVWHYFILTSRWGDVPFVLEPADLDEARQPVTPKEEVLDIIFPLGEEIANKLPVGTYSSNKYMLNQLSMKAIIMRYALYFERYELAARLAEEIMDSKEYSLHPEYGELFQYEASDKNNEVILHQNRESFSGSTYAFPHLGPHFRTGYGQSYIVPLKSLVDSYWTLQGRAIDNCPYYTKEEYELDPNLNRDPRYEFSIMGHGDDFYGETIDVYNSESTMFYEKTRAGGSGYWFRKFVSDDDAFKNGSNMEFPLLRYAEVLLTYAEAKIMMNDVDALAKECINQLRERAGLDMSEADVTLPEYSAFGQNEWVELIRNERRVELAAEGRRYDDIIRWKIAEDVLNQPALGHTRKVDGQLVSLKIEDRSFAQHQYLWPYHESSLKVNPGLKQNPGY